MNLKRLKTKSKISKILTYQIDRSSFKRPKSGGLKTMLCYKFRKFINYSKIRDFVLHPVTQNRGGQLAAGKFRLFHSYFVCVTN